MYIDQLCAPAIEVVEAGEDEVADGEEVARVVLELEVQEDRLAVDEAGGTAEDHGMSRDVVVRVGVAQVDVATVTVHQIQVAQSHCQAK